jgi:uncharacterized protein (TIGR00730 family)
LSGTVRGQDDPGRRARAELLSLLFANGWDIYNSNGDQRITLANIERKIVESDAFVFTPGATLEDLFKAISIFVGYQTLDRNLAGKPTVVLNTDGSWDPIFGLLGHLRGQGTIRQDYRDFLLRAEQADGVLEALEHVRLLGLPEVERPRITESTVTSYETPPGPGHAGNVCVFCSASIEESGYLADGYALGRMLAEQRYGCVSGAGNSGIMGAVVRGSVEAGGWAGGSNVPHIIELEGLPDGLASFWLRADIYTRMEVMIENSDAFVIFPGGAGTVQEMLALMIFKQQGNPLMTGKPVVVFNRLDGNGERFWDPLIAMLEALGTGGMFEIVDELADLVPTVIRMLERETLVTSK